MAWTTVQPVIKMVYLSANSRPSKLKQETRFAKENQ